jgi:hypothetical protein
MAFLTALKLRSYAVQEEHSFPKKAAHEALCQGTTSVVPQRRRIKDWVSAPALFRGPQMHRFTNLFSPPDKRSFYGA